MVSENARADIQLLKIKLAFEKRNFRNALRDDFEFSYLKNILSRIRSIEKDLVRSDFRLKS